MARRATLALALVASVLSAVGCAGRAPQYVTTPSEQPTAAVSSAAVDAIKPMTLAEKRSKIATSFPIEVPLPVGAVTRGEAQGTTAWDYELTVDAPPATVADWYREFYATRNWEVAREDALPGGGVSLTLLKNGAQTRVTLEPQGDAKTKASGVLGVGTQVLQTQ